MSMFPSDSVELVFSWPWTSPDHSYNTPPVPGDTLNAPPRLPENNDTQGKSQSLTSDEPLSPRGIPNCSPYASPVRKFTVRDTDALASPKRNSSPKIDRFACIERRYLEWLETGVMPEGCDTAGCCHAAPRPAARPNSRDERKRAFVARLTPAEQRKFPKWV